MRARSLVRMRSCSCFRNVDTRSLSIPKHSSTILPNSSLSLFLSNLFLLLFALMVFIHSFILTLSHLLKTKNLKSISSSNLTCFLTFLLGTGRQLHSDPMALLQIQRLLKIYKEIIQENAKKKEIL